MAGDSPQGFCAPQMLLKIVLSLLGYCLTHGFSSGTADGLSWMGDIGILWSPNTPHHKWVNCYASYCISLFWTCYFACLLGSSVFFFYKTTWLIILVNNMSDSVNQELFLQCSGDHMRWLGLNPSQPIARQVPYPLNSGSGQSWTLSTEKGCKLFVFRGNMVDCSCIAMWGSLKGFPVYYPRDCK